MNAVTGVGGGRLYGGLEDIDRAFKLFRVGAVGIDVRGAIGQVTAGCPAALVQAIILVAPPLEADVRPDHDRCRVERLQAGIDIEVVEIVLIRDKVDFRIHSETCRERIVGRHR